MEYSPLILYLNSFPQLNLNIGNILELTFGNEKAFSFLSAYTHITADCLLAQNAPFVQVLSKQCSLQK